MKDKLHKLNIIIVKEFESDNTNKYIALGYHIVKKKIHENK